MGRVFLENFGGARVFNCSGCEAFLTNRKELISTRFTGPVGRAFLFDRVVNITEGKVHSRSMLTGRHMVRDVFCKKCKTKLGWKYEFSVENDQRYKEGKVILERYRIYETDGLKGDS